MDLLRYAQDVFGQKMLVGVNWDFLWVPVAAACAVIVVHQIVRRLRKSA